MHFSEIVATTFEPTTMKVVATILMVLVFLVGDVHSQALIAILMLMSIDTAFGLAASWQEKQAITSRRFSRVVQKGIVYFMAISAGYFADLTIGYHFIQATMIGFIGVTEFISVIENMGRLGYQTPKKLLNQLKDFQSQK